MIVTLYSYVPPEYGSYKYPQWAQVFGWFVAVIPLVPIPIFAYRELRNAPGSTLMEVGIHFECNYIIISQFTAFGKVMGFVNIWPLPIVPKTNLIIIPIKNNRKLSILKKKFNFKN